MVYAIVEEIARIFRHIDTDFNLGLFSSTSTNQTLFQVIISFPLINSNEMTKIFNSDWTFIG